jgi:predicted HTH domain antitoxin
MTVTFELPEDIEQHLRLTFSDLGQAAKEAALVELYRQGHIAQRDLAQALGRSRLEVEALLKEHGVIEDLPTEAEHDAALARLGASRGT